MMFKKITILFIGMLPFCLLVTVSNCARAEKVGKFQTDIHGSVYETYDDNIYFTGNDKKDDIITNLDVGMTMKYNDEFKDLVINGDIIHEMFWDNDNLNNTSEELGLNYEQELSKYDRLKLTDLFSHTYEPITFEKAFGRTLGRYSYYTNDIVVEYIRDISKQTQIKAFYANGLDVFDSDERKDSNANSIGLEADYFVTSATTVLSSYEFLIRDFERGASAYRHRFSPGFRHDLTKQFSIEAKTGLDYINSYYDENYLKPMVYLKLSDELNRVTQISVSFIKQYGLNAYDEDIFNEWGVFASLTRQPIKNFSYMLSLFYGEGKYVTADIRDRFLGAGVKCFYSLTESAELVAAYEYSKVNSNEQDREYSKNKVSLGLRIGF